MTHMVESHGIILHFPCVPCSLCSLLVHPNPVILISFSHTLGTLLVQAANKLGYSPRSAKAWVKAAAPHTHLVALSPQYITSGPASTQPTAYGQASPQPTNDWSASSQPTTNWPAIQLANAEQHTGHAHSAGAPEAGRQSARSFNPSNNRSSGFFKDPSTPPSRYSFSKTWVMGQPAGAYIDRRKQNPRRPSPSSEVGAQVVREPGSPLSTATLIYMYSALAALHTPLVMRWGALIAPVPHFKLKNAGHVEVKAVVAELRQQWVECRAALGDLGGVGVQGLVGGDAAQSSGDTSPASNLTPRPPSTPARTLSSSTPSHANSPQISAASGPNFSPDPNHTPLPTSSPTLTLTPAHLRNLTPRPDPTLTLTSSPTQASYPELERVARHWAWGYVDDGKLTSHKDALVLHAWAHGLLTTATAQLLQRVRPSEQASQALGMSFPIDHTRQQGQANHPPTFPASPHSPPSQSLRTQMSVTECLQVGHAWDVQRVITG